MMTCLICSYHQGDDNLCSALGASPICMDCFEHRAERPIDIHRATHHARARGSMRDIKDLLRNATCWAGHDDGYMTLATYEKRITAQMPVPCQPQPIDVGEERDADAVLRQMRKVLDTVSTPEPAPRRRKPWFVALLAFFGLLREIPA